MVSFSVQGITEASSKETVMKEMQKDKGHFFKNFNPSSSKQFWKTVKTLNKINVSIPALVRNGTTVTKDLTRPPCLTNTSPNVSTWPNHHFQADMRNLTLVIALKISLFCTEKGVHV